MRNLFPTVANTGVVAHHHSPPASTWDAPADAITAAKEAELAAIRSQDIQQQQQQGQGPDWAEQRGTAYTSSAAAARAKAFREERERRTLLQKQKGLSSSSDEAAKLVSVDSSTDEEALPLAKVTKELTKLPKELQKDFNHLVEDSKQAVEERRELLKLRAAEAAAEAEARLEQARSDAEEKLKRAIKKASPSPRQQFILIRWAQKVAGALVGVATAAFLLFYQWVVEPAPPHSLRVRGFAYLTQVRVLVAPCNPVTCSLEVLSSFAP